MARKRGRIDYLNEADEVARLYRSEKEAWKKERLLAIKLLLETDKTLEQVADIVGRARSRIQVWVKKFREGGIVSLLTRGNGGGRKSRVTPVAQKAIIEKLREGTFRTAKQFQSWLKSEHQIELSEKGIYYHLGKLGGRLKAPRPSHIKKDPEAVKEFRETLAQKMHALDLEKEKPVKLWVYDEARFGLHPLLRKMWSLVGHRVIAPVHRRFEWEYLFGAIEVGSGESEFLFTDGLSKEFDREFLKQISAQDPGCEHVVIGDGAGFHHKENQQCDEPLPTNVHVLTLPPYSPELNPIEKLWDIVKDRVCTKCWESLEELEKAITQVLKEWWSRPKGFLSLFRQSYLRSELNAIWKTDKPLLF